MNTRLIKLISVVLTLSLAGTVQADTTWTGADPADDLWSTAGNWDSGVPDSADWAKIRNGLPGPTLVGEAEASRVHIGYAEGGALTVDGGTLVIVDTGDDLLLGKQGGSGILNMISGSITINRDLEVAGGAPGFINMRGGTIIVGDDFEIPELEDDLASTAEVNLDGGTIILDNSFEGDSRLRMYSRGKMDVQGGTLIIAGDSSAAIQEYIDNGWITPYEEWGGGTLYLDYDLTNSGKTTLRAVHTLKPYPADGGSVAVPVGDLELSWTAPDPCVPGQSVPVNVYITSDYYQLFNFTDPASMQKLDRADVNSVVVPVTGKTRYYWAVDAYVGSPEDPVIGPMFSFWVGNQAPTVEIAADPPAAWLPDGNVVNLYGTITDDFTAEPTPKWSVVSEPNEGTAVIDNVDANGTFVTFSELGVYTLRLTADDGEDENNIGSDEITIEVFENSCEAAKSLPGFVPILGDLNADCRKNFFDFALFAAGWLDCNALDCGE